MVVNPNDTQTLTFYNTPSTTLVIEKCIEGTTTRIKGVTFLVTDSSGAVIGNSNGEFVTDEAGRIVLEGAMLDITPKSIKIKAGEVQYLRFYNKMQGTLVVRKLDKQTGEPLAEVEFQITYSDGSYLDDDYGHLSSKGLYKMGPTGEIRINGVVGTLVISEVTPFKNFGLGIGTEAEGPVELSIRCVLFLVLAWYADDIVNMALDIGGTPYDWILTNTLPSLNFADFSSVLLTIIGACANGAVALIVLILVLIMAWNYIKLLFEAAERYVLLGVLVFTTPVAFALGASQATSNIFKSWCRMFAGQIFLLLMNAWCLRLFTSMVGTFLSNPLSL